MKTLITTVLVLAIAGISICPGENAQKERSYEKIVKGYFSGWEKKDWSIVESYLAPEFTFTSPAPDDHINIEQFKKKCWSQAPHIRGFEFVKIIGNDKEAFAIMHVITMENRVIRNTEHFNFSNGKIKSIEVFFGGTGQGFPTNNKGSN